VARQPAPRAAIRRQPARRVSAQQHGRNSPMALELRPARGSTDAGIAATGNARRGRGDRAVLPQANVATGCQLCVAACCRANASDDNVLPPPVGTFSEQNPGGSTARARQAVSTSRRLSPSNSSHFVARQSTSIGFAYSRKIVLSATPSIPPDTPAPSPAAQHPAPSTSVLSSRIIVSSAPKVSTDWPLRNWGWKYKRRLREKRNGEDARELRVVVGHSANVAPHRSQTSQENA
jgi:hypothetical protein